MDLEAAVFPLLLMTCCNGDECSVYSNAIFWHSSCEKGHLLNATRRKLLFWESRNSDSTINLDYFSSPLPLLLGSNCSRAWSEAAGARSVCGCRSKRAQVPAKGAPSTALRASIYRLKTGMSSKPINGGVWQEGQAVTQSQLCISLGKSANISHVWLFNLCIPRQKIYIKQKQRLKTRAIHTEATNTGWQSVTSSPLSLASEQCPFGRWRCSRTVSG